jgi:hypothetical protein
MPKKHRISYVAIAALMIEDRFFGRHALNIVTSKSLPGWNNLNAE